MPTLDWIGKKAVVDHHKQVPFHLLRCNDTLSVGVSGSGNLLVQGDNLLALKALLPYYAGQVKCIYIDPPYNTGADERDESGKRTGWIYSDNVNSPEIKEWLNRVVGLEAEDLSRHDKWLCMMYPRLNLLHQFLVEDGVIFASIDEVEYANVKLLFDEIFGVGNRVGTIIWDNATDNNPTNIAMEHEYIICYAKNKARLNSVWKSQNLAVKDKLLEVGEDFVKRLSDNQKRQEEYTKWFRENRNQLWPFEDYKFIDDGGIFTGMRSVHNPGKEGYRYDVIHPFTKKPCKQPMMGYRFPQETMEKLISEGRILFGKDETKLVELKVYVRDYRAKLSSIFTLDGRVGTNEIKEILHHDKRPFDFPKPTALIEEILSFTTSGNDIVLDSFAGSGTTGHAVMKLNKAENKNRRFILVEMKKKIAREITAERLKRVAEGYVNAKGELVPGLGGGYRFCELGESLFNSDCQIAESVTFKDLAHHVFFMATGEPLPQAIHLKAPLLGVSNGIAVYLLYNGILGDKSINGGNVLTREVLSQLPKHNGTRIVYGSGCRISSERLRRENIIFRQVPYEVKIS